MPQTSLVAGTRWHRARLAFLGLAFGAVAVLLQAPVSDAVAESTSLVLLGCGLAIFAHRLRTGPRTSSSPAEAADVTDLVSPRAIDPL